MKLKILSAFTVGLLTGLGIGAGVTAWMHQREATPGIKVERLRQTGSGAIYRIQSHE